MAKKRSRRKQTPAQPKDSKSVETPPSTSASKTLWVVAAVASMVALATLFMREPTPASAPDEGEVFPVEVELPRSPPAESLFAAVDPNRDRWKSEAVNEELEAALKKVAAALVDGTGMADALSPLLSPAFRSVALEPKTATRKSSVSELQITDVVYDEALSLDREASSEALDDWLRDVTAIDYVKFTIVAVDLDGDDGNRAETRILFELNGKSQDGGLVARRTEGNMGWRREDGTWKISELAFERGTEVASPSAPFTDVSALAFANVDSYRRQMALGINDFRTRLDAASGIDVFAHNGVSIVDADGDGLEDVFVAQPAGLPNRLYRNRGDGTFEDVSAEAGVDILDRTSMGLFADFDNDGDDDLALILQNEAPVLLTNDGHGSFQRSTSTPFERADGARVTYSSAAAADYDGDSYVDLYVAAYLEIDAPGADKELPLPYPYHDAENGAANVLFRNLGDGRFEDVTAKAGLDQGNNRFSLAASWGDYDGDGRLDLYVANDFGRNNLYHNEGNGRFRDVSAEAGVEDLGAGMSVAWVDYDNDGHDDLYVGNMWSSAGQRLTHQADYQASELRASYARHAKGSTLFHNRGDGGFDDVSEHAGVELGRWAWGSDFFDADNDGDDDLYIANGYITNRSDRDL